MMKRFIFSAVLIMACLITAQAQKFALIDMEYILKNIPAKAYEYIVNGKSAIDWILERYAATQDKDSLITNDCNDWALEHQNPRYILDTLVSVIDLSLKTMEIVNGLPKLDFGE